MKTIDLDMTVADLVHAKPEVKDILFDLGFKDIVKPLALHTMGRFMTIPKGAAVKEIPLDKVVAAFQAKGFEVVQGGKTFQASEAQDLDEKDLRARLLQTYIARLSAGEDMESVRADFVKAFESVDAAEIAAAEQSLIEAGTPVEEVTQLCDVHSALFHTHTTGEVEVDPLEAYQAHPGHPIAVLLAENVVIQGRIDQVKIALVAEDGPGVLSALKDLASLASHYGKKGDLIYPLLNRTYGFSGPSEVMWSVDDEIRDEIRTLCKKGDQVEDFLGRAQAVVTRAEEMVYKEDHILLPLVAEHFTEEDFMRIYYDLPQYETLLEAGVHPVWPEAEARREDLEVIGGKSRQEGAEEGSGAHIPLGSGLMTPEEILGLLDTLPLEITFVDKNDRNAFFNDNGEKKVFKRPNSAIGRDVWSCHPPKIEKEARKIIDAFKAGEKDQVHVPMRRGDRMVSVKYLAVRNQAGNYLGTLEIVQDITEFQKFF